RRHPAIYVHIKERSFGIVLETGDRPPHAWAEQERIAHSHRCARFPSMESRRYSSTIRLSAFHLDVRLYLPGLRTQTARDPVCPEIARHAIEAAAGHDPCSIPRRLRVVSIDERTDPRCLARDVDVVGSMSHARIHDALAV